MLFHTEENYGACSYLCPVCMQLGEEMNKASREGNWDLCCALDTQRVLHTFNGVLPAEFRRSESAEIVHDETEAAEAEAAEAEAAESEAVKTVPAAPAPAQMQREIPSCFFACMFDAVLLAAHQDEYPNCPECSWTRMSGET